MARSPAPSTRVRQLAQSSVGSNLRRQTTSDSTAATTALRTPWAVARNANAVPGRLESSSFLAALRIAWAAAAAPTKPTATKQASLAAVRWGGVRERIFNKCCFSSSPPVVLLGALSGLDVYCTQSSLEALGYLWTLLCAGLSYLTAMTVHEGCHRLSIASHVSRFAHVRTIFIFLIKFNSMPKTGFRGYRAQFTHPSRARHGDTETALETQFQPAHPLPAMESRVGRRIARRLEHARRRRVDLRVEEQRAERGEDGRMAVSDVHALGRVFVQIEEALDAGADARGILAVVVVVRPADVLRVRVEAAAVQDVLVLAADGRAAAGRLVVEEHEVFRG